MKKYLLLLSLIFSTNVFSQVVLQMDTLQHISRAHAGTGVFYGDTVTYRLIVRNAGTALTTSVITVSTGLDANLGILNSTESSSTYYDGSSSWTISSPFSPGQSDTLVLTTIIYTSGPYYGTSYFSLSCSDVTPFSRALNYSVAPQFYAFFKNSSPLYCRNSCLSDTAIVSGGQRPYTYAWPGHTAKNDSTHSFCGNSFASPQKVFVTDSLGDTTSAYLYFNGQDSLSLSIHTDSLSQKCHNIIHVVTDSSSAQPFAYAWSNSKTALSSGQSGLCTGTYTVTVQDANACAAVKSILLSAPPDLSINIGHSVINNGTHAGTNLFKNDTILYQITLHNNAVYQQSNAVSVADSFPPGVKYVSSTATKGNYNKITGKWSIASIGAHGSETLTVKAVALANSGQMIRDTASLNDGTGHPLVATSSIIVNYPLHIVLSQAAPVMCRQGCISETAHVNGGTGPYNYSFGAAPAPDSTGKYCGIVSNAQKVKITDALNDTASVSFSFTSLDTVGFRITEALKPGCGNVLTAASSGANGITPYSYSWGAGLSDSVKQNVCPGNYTVSVTDFVGCSATASVTISSVPVLFVDTTITPSQCSTSSGGIKISPHGGMNANDHSSYSAYLSDQYGNSIPLGGGPLVFTASGLSAGIYTISVTSSNPQSNVYSSVFSLQNSDGPQAALTLTNLKCKGDNSGQAVLNSSGSILPYSYTWSNGYTESFTNSASTATGLAANTQYFATVTLGTCNAYATFRLSEPPALSVSVPDATVSCHLMSDGVLTASLSGGTMPYSYASYLWSYQSKTTNSISGLSPGTYSVTVADVNGCMASASATVNDAAPLTIHSSVLSSVSCNSGNNGSAGVNVSGGSGSYVFSWNDDSHHQKINSAQDTLYNMSAGRLYTVSVSDSNNPLCQATSGLTLTQPSSISVNQAGSSSGTCMGGTPGSTSISVSGGVGPYRYLWSDGTQSNTVSGVAGQLYICTVTDANSCATVFASAIPSTDGPQIDHISFTAASASPGNDGTASVYVVPGSGTPDYNFYWSNGFYTLASPGLTQSTATTLSGNTLYSVTVSDASGCIAGTCVNITAPALLSVSIAFSDIDCSGQGSATAIVSGGSGSYTYLWSGGSGSGNSVTVTSSGSYSVTVDDGAGQTDSARVTIAQPGGITIPSVYQHNISCFGLSNGSIDSIQVSGGTPYKGLQRYLVSTDAGTLPAKNLAQGVYVITVTDSKGCTATGSASITSPGAFTIVHQNKINPSCYGLADGSVQIEVVHNSTYPSPAYPASDGSSPYQYELGTVNGNITTSNTPVTVNSLAEGFYYVSVSDQNGCVALDSLTLSAPVRILFDSPIITNPVCYNSDATVDICVTNGSGTAPFTYIWPSGSSGNTVNNCATGNMPAGYPSVAYLVSVTDANSCRETISITVSSPPQLIISSSSGSSYGCATALASGGSGAYSYLWSPAPAPSGPQTTAICNLTSGTYYVTATDANACSSSPAAVIVPATHASLSLSKDTVMKRMHPGTAIVSGDTVLYQIKVVNNATGSNYTINVIDTVPAGIKFLGSTASAGSFNSGTQTWTLDSVKGNGSALLTLKCVIDTDSVIVMNRICTDDAASPYRKTASVAFTVAPHVRGTVSPSQHTVCSMTPVQFFASAAYGAGNYSYLWDNGKTTVLTSFTDSVTTIHFVTVTDIAGYASIVPAVVTINPLPLPEAVVYSHQTSCRNGIIVNPLGKAPYTITWNTGVMGDSLKNICPGTYSVSVTDANNCSAQQQVTVSAISGEIGITKSQSFIHLYPGSNIYAGDTVVYNLGVTNNASFAISNINILDTLPAGLRLISSFSAQGLYDTSSHKWVVNSLAPGEAGTLIYKCLIANGFPYTPITNKAWFKDSVFSAEEADASFQLSPQMGVRLDSLRSICQGACETVSAVVINGGGSYTYSWDGAAFTTKSKQQYCDAVTAAHILVVADAQGDTVQTPFNVIVDPAPHVKIVVDSLQSGCKIAVHANAYGSSLLKYQWSEKDTMSRLSNLCAGLYKVTVSDMYGCSAKDSVTISLATSLTVKLKGTNPSCYGSSDGKISVVLDGGIAPFAYTWSPKVTNLSALPQGTYAVTVTDAVNNVNSSSIVLNQPDSLTVKNDSTHVIVKNLTCPGINKGQIKIVPTGGTAPYQYSWSDGSGSTNTLFNTSSGAYICTITDYNACTYRFATTVSQPPVIKIAAAKSSLNCYGDSSATISITTSGGTPPLGYLWNDKVATANRINLKAGTYVLQVTDSKQCIENLSVTILQPAKLTDNIAFTYASCVGCSDGSATVNVTGGVGPYTYVWSPVTRLTKTITGLKKGTYIVAIADQHTCRLTDSVYIKEETNPFQSGIDSLNTTSGIKVYPNPASDIIVIERALSVEQPTVSICSVNGEILYKGILSGDKLTVDCSKWPGGMYLLQVGDRRFKIIRE